MYINCDRCIATMIIITITILTFKNISIIILKDMNIIILMKIFKTINEKIDDSDLLSDDADFKFESNVNINVRKKARKICDYNYNNDKLILN